jgi:excinuclease ABC subunit C
MARTLGITHRDRDRLVDRITAVLSRDETAVAGVEADLRDRREQAVATLSFEVAARIQAEIQALEWITSTQRVTTLEPADLDVHGWHDGVLVRLRMRAGHLSSWSQRPSTRADAEVHLGTTPAVWADFAQHNAVLAANLRTATPVARTARSAQGR